MPRTVAECPVAECPWTYDLTDLTTEDGPGGRIVLVVPPPAGVAPHEALAGLRAARPVMSAAPPAASLDDAIRAAQLTASTQDNAVLLEHLCGHTRAQLQAALPADALAQLSRLLPAG